jgi:hypothetical protein
MFIVERLQQFSEVWLYWTELSCSSKPRTKPDFILLVSCQYALFLFPTMRILSWLNKWRQQKPCWILPPYFTSTYWAADCRCVYNFADILPKEETENTDFFFTLYQPCAASAQAARRQFLIKKTRIQCQCTPCQRCISWCGTGVGPIFSKIALNLDPFLKEEYQNWVSYKRRYNYSPVHSKLQQSI